MVKPRISREKARKITTWKMLEDALETGEFVTGKIHNRVKGGFAVEVEVVKAFLPGSFGRCKTGKRGS
jgi:small subunit ribosomal protein S1